MLALKYILTYNKVGREKTFDNEDNRAHILKLGVLKTVAFIAGKKNPADQNFYICFSIEIKLKKMIFKSEIAPKIKFKPT